MYLFSFKNTYRIAVFPKEMCSKMLSIPHLR